MARTQRLPKVSRDKKGSNRREIACPAVSCACAGGCRPRTPRCSPGGLQPPSAIPRTWASGAARRRRQRG
eukprot:1722035-Alexandrium_andersonii.AAC.1